MKAVDCAEHVALKMKYGGIVVFVGLAKDLLDFIQIEIGKYHLPVRVLLTFIDPFPR